MTHDTRIDLTERDAWLIALRTPGLGNLRIAKLHEHFGSLRAALDASRGALRASGLPDAVCAELARSGRGLIRPDLDWLEAAPDRHLLTLTPEHVIRVSPALGGCPYEHCDGRALPMPSDASDRPSPLALRAHNADCRWLVASANKLFSRLRIYARVKNAFTFTKYTGMDPEVNYYGTSNVIMGTDFFTYPQARAIIFCLNLGF